MAAFAGQAPALGVARLTVDGESITMSGAPEVNISGTSVKIPPGAFLQASREAEATLIDLVRGGVGDAKRVGPLRWPRQRELARSTLSKPMKPHLPLSAKPRAVRQS